MGLGHTFTGTMDHGPFVLDFLLSDSALPRLATLWFPLLCNCGVLLSRGGGGALCCGQPQRPRGELTEEGFKELVAIELRVLVHVPQQHVDVIHPRQGGERREVAHFYGDHDCHKRTNSVVVMRAELGSSRPLIFARCF